MNAATLADSLSHPGGRQENTSIMSQSNVPSTVKSTVRIASSSGAIVQEFPRAVDAAGERDHPGFLGRLIVIEDDGRH